MATRIAKPPTTGALVWMNAAEVYHEYNDAENRRDITALRALVTSDLIVTVNGRPALASGEEDRAVKAELRRCYPNYRREIVATLAEGNQAAVRWRLSGTPAAELPGLTPIDVHGCSIIRIRGGRIVGAAMYYDSAAMDAVIRRALLARA
ncbi:ester cyclase [Amycolatopsis nigrescens]|uniref:ester cyclase n=1 Tax=Amycolatopsis nigrescens TaxID=381445 RepID=UPI00039C9625|nr:nuclear transport factor 2 family protein [Amycolatopsis nigrescens]